MKTNRKSGRPPKKRNRLSINSGRKKVSAKNASRSTKYERANDLVDNDLYSLEILELAATLKKKKEVRMEIPDESSEYEQHELENNIHSEESALACYLENDFSVRTYRALVSDSFSRNSRIYPADEFVKIGMDKCLPENIQSTEVEVVVSLQKMLNKSVERLCESVALDWDENCLKQLQLIATLGFDSSSGHTNAQQKCSNKYNEDLNPLQSLFVSSIILISIRCNCRKHSWLNKTPQSIRFCRPLRIALEKEDKRASLLEFERLSTEIKNLLEHTFELSNNKLVKIKYDIYQTLFDGKCLNTIVRNAATSRCPMCNQTSHTFGNLSNDSSPNISSLKYDLGLLHCEIKCLEHFINISYRATMRSWDVRKDLRGI